MSGRHLGPQHSYECPCSADCGLPLSAGPCSSCCSRALCSTSSAVCLRSCGLLTRLLAAAPPALSDLLHGRNQGDMRHAQPSRVSCHSRSTDMQFGCSVICLRQIAELRMAAYNDSIPITLAIYMHAKWSARCWSVTPRQRTCPPAGSVWQAQRWLLLQLAIMLLLYMPSDLSRSC
jgi:hypothetical protein